MPSLIEIALAHYGEDAQGKTYPWCAEFMNRVLEEAGLEGSDSLMARSFLKIGLHTEEPALGDIVVLWRVDPQSIYGHAGFYVREVGDYFYLLGGNQDNIVKIKSYPKWQLLEIRRATVRERTA